MVEVINQVKAAEESAEELKKQARRSGTQQREDAQTAGRKLLEQQAQRAAQEAATILDQAQRKADAYLESSHEESRGLCDALKASAGQKLDRAAEFIVERIVGSL